MKPISPSGGCWYPDPAVTTEVRCAVAPDAELRLRSGDGSDRVTLHGGVCGWVVLLGRGDDVVDTLDGRRGHDVISGGGGGDTLYGGSGDDTLDGGAGVDDLDGGWGTDVCDVGPDGGTEASCEG